MMQRRHSISPEWSASIVLGRNDVSGIALHRHAMSDPTEDYVSFTHLKDPDSPILS